MVSPPGAAGFGRSQLSLFNSIVSSVYKEHDEEPIATDSPVSTPHLSSPEHPSKANMSNNSDRGSTHEKYSQWRTAGKLGLLLSKKPAWQPWSSHAQQQASSPASQRPCRTVLDLPNDCLLVVLQRVAVSPVPVVARTNTLNQVPGSSVPRASTVSTPEGLPGQIVRRVSNVGVLTDQGLKDIARMAIACRRLRSAYREVLDQRPDLALQVEQNRRALSEKRRLVRRLTITHHQAYMRREVVWEAVGGAAVIGTLTAGCTAYPGLCGSASGVLNFAVFTFTHVLIHTAILMAAYRVTARVGVCRSLLGGLSATVLYYCLLVPVVQWMAGIHSLPPQLDLEPWCRFGTPTRFLCAASSAHPHPPHHAVSGDSHDNDGTAAAMAHPNWLLAVLLWPFFGTSATWRAVHVLSNGFAWAYGVWEFRTSYGYTKARNRLI